MKKTSKPHLTQSHPSFSDHKTIFFISYAGKPKAANNEQIVGSLYVSNFRDKTE